VTNNDDDDMLFGNQYFLACNFDRVYNLFFQLNGFG